MKNFRHQYFMEQRCLAEAEYILKEKCTVRQLAAHFKISKSTVHKDLTERLEHINPSKARQVREILQYNKEQAVHRGGQATKQKWEKNKA